MGMCICSCHLHRCINGTSTFDERYNAQHDKLPIKSYRCRVPLFRSTIAQLVSNYGEFPAGSEFSLKLAIYDLWQKLQPFE